MLISRVHLPRACSTFRGGPPSAAAASNPGATTVWIEAVVVVLLLVIVVVVVVVIAAVTAASVAPRRRPPSRRRRRRRRRRRASPSPSPSPSPSSSPSPPPASPPGRSGGGDNGGDRWRLSPALQQQEQVGTRTILRTCASEPRLDDHLGVVGRRVRGRRPRVGVGDHLGELRDVEVDGVGLHRHLVDVLLHFASTMSRELSVGASFTAASSCASSGRTPPSMRCSACLGRPPRRSGRRPRTGWNRNASFKIGSRTRLRLVRQQQLDLLVGGAHLLEDLSPTVRERHPSRRPPKNSRSLSTWRATPAEHRDGCLCAIGGIGPKERRRRGLLVGEASHLARAAREEFPGWLPPPDRRSAHPRRGRSRA